MPNAILTEIRQTRDDLARETGYNLKQLFDCICEREREAAASGVKYVPLRPEKKKPPTSCGTNRPSRSNKLVK